MLGYFRARGLSGRGPSHPGARGILPALPPYSYATASWHVLFSLMRSSDPKWRRFSLGVGWRRFTANRRRRLCFLSAVQANLQRRGNSGVVDSASLSRRRSRMFLNTWIPVFIPDRPPKCGKKPAMTSRF